MASLPASICPLNGMVRKRGLSRDGGEGEWKNKVICDGKEYHLLTKYAHNLTVTHCMARPMFRFSHLTESLTIQWE